MTFIEERRDRHRAFTGPIGPSMAEFSAEYMTYVEGHLEKT